MQITDPKNMTYDLAIQILFGILFVLAGLVVSKIKKERRQEIPALKKQSSR